MTDRGVVSRGEFDGEKDVLGIRLNWDKRYITLAPVATLLGLAFKLFDPDHLLGDKEDIGITLALIPTDTTGVEIGRRHFPLNMTFQNGPTQGKDVFIPIDWIIGGSGKRRPSQPAEGDGEQQAAHGVAEAEAQMGEKGPVEIGQRFRFIVVLSGLHFL